MHFSRLKIFLQNHWVLLIILMVAFLLRTMQITQPLIDIFSWRQSSTAMMAENFYKLDWNIFYPQVNWTGPGTGYQGREFQTITYLAAIGYKIFGQHDYIGRIIAVAFGMWGLIALYNLVLLVWDKRHALAGTAMMAIIPGSVLIDRSFLPDPVMVSLTTTCMWLFVLYLQKDRSIYLWLAAAAGCLGILTKIPGMIIAFPMTYALVSFFKQQGELHYAKIKPILFAAILVLIPVTAYYLWARHLSMNYPPYHFAGSGNWIWNNWKIYIQEKYFLSKMKEVFEFWLLGFPAIYLFILGLLFLPPQNKSNNSPGLKWFFHFMLLGCLFYYFIGGRELVRNPWNFHLFLPVISVFCGRSLIILFSYNHLSTKQIFIPIALVFLLILWNNVRMLKQRLFFDPGAAQGYLMGKELKALKQPGELVITLPHNIGDPVAIYYSGGKGFLFPPAYKWAPTELPKEDEECIAILEDLRSQGADWFGIVDKHFQEISNNRPAFKKYLDNNMKMVKQTNDFILYKW